MVGVLVVFCLQWFLLEIFDGCTLSFSYKNNDLKVFCLFLVGESPQQGLSQVVQVLSLLDVCICP